MAELLSLWEAYRGIRSLGCARGRVSGAVAAPCRTVFLTGV
jgi:hypothetical protein